MKIQYLVSIMIILFILGCSAKEIEEPLPMGPDNEMISPPENVPIEEPIIPIEEELPPEDLPKPQENIIIEIPEEVPIENVVMIKDSGFDPVDITIYKGETITWVTDVEKISKSQSRKIACYSGAYRIFLGESLTENGQKSRFKFEEPGEYLCQEFIYGSRGTIKVKQFSRPAITGAVIGAIDGASIAPMIIVIGFILMALSFLRRDRYYNKDF
ncbi:MAG: hypothetical protein ABIJ08_06570 [Nanoarchaeota archaeon]